MLSLRRLIRSAAAGLLVTWCAAAHAYIGPGLGVGAAVVVLGIVFAMIMLAVGLIFYPVRRLRRSMKEAKAKRALGGSTPNKQSTPEKGSPTSNDH